ncbi:MAG: tetratricopeptide repeat protein, partial [Gammaproteobacteria bacterium]|nr:tetratricopeptide repeat protein [Gammaproteobacteria bacterium]
MRRNTAGKLTRTGFVLLLGLAAGAAAGGSASDKLYSEARDFLQRGETRSAVIQLKNLLEREPTNLQARLLLGDVNVRLGDWAGAEKEFRHAKDLGVPPSEWKPRLGLALLMQGSFDALLDEIVVAGSEPPAEQAQLLALRGQALLGLGRRSEARAAFEQSLALDAKSERARLGSATLLIAEARREEGLRQIDALLADAPDNVSALLVRAEARRAEGKLEEAVADFGRVLEKEPANLQARIGRVLAELALRRVEPAQKDLDALPPAMKDQPVARYLRALLAYLKNDLAGTAEHLDYVLRAAPNHLQALLLYGAVSYAKGDYQLADD